MAETLRYDAVVIGAGTGGYPAGIRLGQLGVKSVVIDKEYAGGVCLNVGCIPSKALIHAAKMFDKVKHLDDLGIGVPGAPTIDMVKLQQWKTGVVKKLTTGVTQLLKGNKSDFIDGEATFVSPRELDVKKKDGTVVRIETKNVIVATGSRPMQIPGFTFDKKRVIDSTDALALTAVPKRLVVVGGGYIGLELGTVYAKLGSKVTVVEMLPTILAGMEPDCVRVVAQKLKKMGIEVVLEAKAKSWEDKGDRAVVTIETKGGLATLDADQILVTVGRKPTTSGFGLDKIGVKMDERGFIITDRMQRTNVVGVYATGDCTPGPMLAHKSSKEAEVAAEVIAGHKAEQDARTIPAVVFTDPELATTGLTEEQAKAGGRKIKVGKYPFAVLGRALSVNDTDGFAKVIGDAETGEVLGVHIVGNGAGDLIAEASLAIEMGAVLDDLSLTIHAHPTLPEAIMEAAKAALGEAIHIMNR
ncbi:MAG TPA: dihydrolipoyl dehydrogenase [Haliangiales bacterium]|nr:dihydrolipoyl dehydrogenase [Haliangiales bacterium]